MLTPTTKAADHDVPISPTEIVSKGLMTQQEWDVVSLCSAMLSVLLVQPAIHQAQDFRAQQMQAKTSRSLTTADFAFRGMPVLLQPMSILEVEML